MSAESFDGAVAARAEGRYGLFTRAEVLELGATSSLIVRRVAEGRWVTVYRGVYRLAGVAPSWRQSLLAAVLYCGQGSAASYGAAGELWRLPNITAHDIDVSVPPTRRVRNANFVVHRPVELHPVDLTVVDAIPVTTPPRTLIDLAGIVSIDVLEEALDDALRRRLVTIRWLRWRIDALGGRGRPGVGALRVLCASREGTEPIPESILETKLFRVLRDAGLPEPVPQYEIRIAGRVYRIDYAYPRQVIAIEADGYASRASRRRWQQELRRQNALVQAGWHVIRFTWDHVVERPDVVAEEVARALNLRRRG